LLLLTSDFSMCILFTFRLSFPISFSFSPVWNFHSWWCLWIRRLILLSVYCHSWSCSS
jgi:hypothetical protein